MVHTLNDHIRQERDPGHRAGLLSVCRDTRETTGVDVGNALLQTQEELGNALGRHEAGRIDLSRNMVENKHKLGETAVTSLHEGLHAKGKRRLGKKKKIRRGKGIKHEGITELGAQTEAIELGYRGFSRVYERRVEGAREMARLITYDRMMEIADADNASVNLQRELTGALVRMHSMPRHAAMRRAEEMEQAAA